MFKITGNFPVSRYGLQLQYGRKMSGMFFLFPILEKQTKSKFARGESPTGTWCERTKYHIREFRTHLSKMHDLRRITNWQKYSINTFHHRCFEGHWRITRTICHTRQRNHFKYSKLETDLIIGQKIQLKIYYRKGGGKRDIFPSFTSIFQSMKVAIIAIDLSTEQGLYNARLRRVNFVHNGFIIKR